MKLEFKSFRTKVARRIFLLFIVCAMVPTTALAVVSFFHVKAQLNEQSRKLLGQQSKNISVSIHERLLLLCAEMRMAVDSIRFHTSHAEQGLPDNLEKQIAERFSPITDQGHVVNYSILMKIPRGSYDFTDTQKAHLRLGKSLLFRSPSHDSKPFFHMVMALDPESLARGIIVWDIDFSYVWEAAKARAFNTEVTVLDGETEELLFSTLPTNATAALMDTSKQPLSHSGHFEWQDDKTDYFAAYRFFGLNSHLSYPGWIIILTQAKRDVYAPMTTFAFVFPVILILAMGTVFLLSAKQIRKTTVPMDTLREATEHIARGEFGYKVEIISGDEFEDLATAFNDMSRKIEEGQALLIQAAKMGAMGQMAAGIVHEIKQPLTAIFGLLQLSLFDAPEGKARERLETMEQAVERLNGILERFRSFAYKSEEKFGALSLKLVVGQVYQLMAHQLSMKKVHCEIEHEQDLPDIVGDRQGLQQVISNLVVNAVDAFEGKEEGERLITIRTFTSEGKVFLEVKDNGCGIPEETLRHVFDPFFTTKGPEKGTGLGLAILDSILHKHHAGIDVKSEVGVGTVFTIIFPAVS